MCAQLNLSMCKRSSTKRQAWPHFGVLSHKKPSAGLCLADIH